MLSISMNRMPVNRSDKTPIGRATLGSERGGPNLHRQPESSQPLVEVNAVQTTASIAKGAQMEVEREWPNSAPGTNLQKLQKQRRLPKQLNEQCKCGSPKPDLTNALLHQKSPKENHLRKALVAERRRHGRALLVFAQSASHAVKV